MYYYQSERIIVLGELMKGIWPGLAPSVMFLVVFNIRLRSMRNQNGFFSHDFIYFQAKQYIYINEFLI